MDTFHALKVVLPEIDIGVLDKREVGKNEHKAAFFFLLENRILDHSLYELRSLLKKLFSIKSYSKLVRFSEILLRRINQYLVDAEEQRRDNSDDCNNRGLELCSRGEVSSAQRLWASGTYGGIEELNKTLVNSLLLQWRCGEIGPSSLISALESAVAMGTMMEHSALEVINSILREGGHGVIEDSRPIQFLSKKIPFVSMTRFSSTQNLSCIASLGNAFSFLGITSNMVVIDRVFYHNNPNILQSANEFVWYMRLYEVMYHRLNSTLSL